VLAVLQIQAMPDAVPSPVYGRRWREATDEGLLIFPCEKLPLTPTPLRAPALAQGRSKGHEPAFRKRPFCTPQAGEGIEQHRCGFRFAEIFKLSVQARGPRPTKMFRRTPT